MKVGEGAEWRWIDGTGGRRSGSGKEYERIKVLIDTGPRSSIG